MKLSKAKNKLLLNHAFWGILLLRLKFVSDPHCNPPTLWTDGETVGFHPDFIESLPYTQIIGCLVHELFHCIMKHHIRMQGRNAKKWNRACDYAINPIIRKAGFELPEWVLDDVQYHDMSAEQIYNLLPDDPEDENDGQGTNGQGALDEVKFCSKPIDQSIQEWDIAVESAHQAVKNKGDLSAILKGIIEEALDPKVPWQNLLRDFMTHPKKDDYSMRRPARRFVHAGLYLPELYSLGLGCVFLCKDTSGSITAQEDKDFNTEVNMIMEDTRPDSIYMAYCDSQLQIEPDLYESHELPFEMKPIKGLGTDFTAPFTWIEENNIFPACFIYFTDMEGDCAAPPPDYPVLWLSTRKNKVAPFGELVEMV